MKARGAGLAPYFSSDLTLFAVIGGALSAGPPMVLESLVRFAAAWLLCVPLKSEIVKRTEPRERMFMLASILVIAWFVGGGVMWLMAAIWILDSLPPASGRLRIVNEWRTPITEVLLPALVAWAALGGLTPIPAPLRVETGYFLEASSLLASNWLVPFTFAALTVSTSVGTSMGVSMRPGRLRVAAGFALAATALAMAGSLVGAAVMALVLVGGFTVNDVSVARPLGITLVIAGLAIAFGGG